jgi:FkbM family methyltransferase
MSPKIVFDVGARTGGGLLRRCRQDPALVVHAFEPVPHYCRRIRRQSAGLENYHVHQAAVSVFDGRAPFYLSHDPLGCDSLLPFVDDANARWKDPFDPATPMPNPAGRLGNRDFRMKERIEVDVIRLDTFIERHRIPRIHRLRVDAQGEDLNVLKSLGRFIDRVASGVIETPTGPALYRGQFTQGEAVRFLEAHGFEIVRREPQYFGLEENLHFRRRS